MTTQPLGPLASSPFAQALMSEEASRTIPARSRIFEPFIGSWQLVVRWFDATGGMSRVEAGEWHFARVPEGRGVQDVWIVPKREGRGTGNDYEYGTSLRFYDPRIDAWQSNWIGPMHQTVRTFVARQIGTRVVLETPSGAENTMRWSFSDIADRSFQWTNDVEENGVWRTQQTFAARRETGTGPHDAAATVHVSAPTRSNKP